MLKKNLNLLTVFGIVSLLLVSCEGMRYAEGYVYDKDTNQPIDSVRCKVIEAESVVYTDSQGYYNVDGSFGGCVFGCKDMTVEYSKVNYQTKTILNPDKDAIYLEKE